MLRVFLGTSLVLIGVIWGFSPSDEINLPNENKSVEKHIPIAEIVVGDRVLALNPQISSEQRASNSEPDFSKWIKIELESSEDNGKIEIEAIRPPTWLKESNAQVGKQVQFDIPEIGFNGLCTVQQIGRPFSVKNGKGSVVTATFNRQVPKCICVYFNNLSKPIRITENHRVWSEDHEDFVAIGKLNVGNNLRTRNGQIKTIQRIEYANEPLQVFNLEVYGEHVYYVSDLELLVHNGCSYIEEYKRLLDHRALNEADFNISDWYKVEGDVELFKTRDYSVPETDKNAYIWMPRNKVDGDHVLPKKPVWDFLKNQGHGKGSDLRKAIDEILNSQENLRSMHDGANSSKNASTGEQWFRGSGKYATGDGAKKIDAQYAAGIVDIQQSVINDIWIALKEYDNKHGTDLAKQFKDSEFFNDVVNQSVWRVLGYVN